MRIARGLFRLWLVLSVLWIGAVGTVTWSHFSERPLTHKGGGLTHKEVGLCSAPFDPSVPELSHPCDKFGMATIAVPIDVAPQSDPSKRRMMAAAPQSDPSKPFEVITYDNDATDHLAWTIRNGALVGLLPPVLVLLLGSSLIWAFRGFRS